MGYDTSFHPVDVKWIQKRILPYIQGKKDSCIAELIEEGVRLARVRFRANAWGLGVTDLDRDDPKTPVPASFDGHLHVWGRPFFITDEAPEAVSRSIDRYLAAADNKEVDRIAKEMLRRMSPGLEKVVKPNKGGKLPGDHALAGGMVRRLNVLCDAYAAMKAKKPFTLEREDEEEEVDPADLLAANLPYVVLDFAANFRPGWMARGHVWPTRLLSEANLATDFFESAVGIFEPLRGKVPRLGENLEATITCNYTLGGYVPPAKVPACLAFVEENRAAIVEANEGCDNDVRKLIEALHDATRRKMGFLEATEIYSGMMGIMN